jgi:hypothetical protein
MAKTIIPDDTRCERCGHAYEQHAVWGQERVCRDLSRKDLPFVASQPALLRGQKDWLRTESAARAIAASASAIQTLAGAAADTPREIDTVFAHDHLEIIEEALAVMKTALGA